MTNKLYVGNLSFSTDDEGLKALFADSGTVQSARVITDAQDGRSKGFGFVEMASEEEARSAMDAVNGKEVDGRAIRVDLARPRAPRPPR